MPEYITVKQEASDMFIEKKSKFIGHCKPVKTEEEALAFIESIKKKHYDASHNVSAYILRDGGLIRFSDDGEPQGKAGIPVLDAMQKNQIVDAVVVATRYFGGTMLGGGGLIRAYSHTASIALAAAKKIIMKTCELLEISCDYTSYGKINSIIPESFGIIDDTVFEEEVKIKLHIAPENVPQMKKEILEATAGRITPKKTDEKFFAFDFL